MQQSNAVAYCSFFSNNIAAENTNPAAPPAAQQPSNQALPAQGASHSAWACQDSRQGAACLHICRLPPEPLEMF